MILHLYFARRFLMTFLATFGIFVVMLTLIDMLEQIRLFSKSDVGFEDMVTLTLLNMPQGLYRILPLITIIASVFLFLGLARSSELVVTRAAGRSALRSLMSPAIVAALIGALAVAALNPIVAATSKRYETMANRLSNGEASTLSINEEGLWLRQGSAEGQTVIRAVGASLDGTVLNRVTFIGLDAQGIPAFRIEAAEARLVPGSWILRDAKEWRFDKASVNPERDAVVHAELELPSNLTLQRIKDSFGTPSTIAFWDLPGFIRDLEHAGFSARSHRVWFQMEMTMPLFIAAMVMIGAAFTLRHTRFGRTGLMVLLSIVTGFGFYLIRNVAQILGDRGQIPVELAAWSPPVAAMLFALGILLHLEDG